METSNKTPYSLSSCRSLLLRIHFLLCRLLLNDSGSFDCPIFEELKTLTTLLLSVAVGSSDKGTGIRS